MVGSLIGHKQAPLIACSSRLAKRLLWRGLPYAFFLISALFLTSASAFAATVYEATVLAFRPVGFWLLNETNGTTAFDSSGHGNNGAYQSMVKLGASGVPNPPFSGFSSNSTAASFNGTANSWVTLNNLPVNSATVTILAWIYPSNAANFGTILWNASQNSGLGGYYQNNAELSYNWNGAQASWAWESGLIPPANQWSFVAMVVTPTNAVFYLGSSNILRSAVNNASNTPVNFTSGSLIGAVGSSNPSRTFNGAMSDVAIFDYALSSSQIAHLLQNANGGAPFITDQSPSQTNFAGSTLRLVASVTGNAPLRYQWKASPIDAGIYTNLANGGNISGVTNSTLVISNATSANAADYIVVASNSQGTATSLTPTTESIVNLTISGPSPSSAFLYPSGNVSFSANVSGPAPITCFWQTNGVPFNFTVSGANVTNTVSVLPISNASASDAVEYCLVATNLYGSATSAPVFLNIVAAPKAGSYAEAISLDRPVAYWRFDERCGTNAYDHANGHNGVFGAEALFGFDGPCSPQWPGFEENNRAFVPLPGFGRSTVTMPASQALNLTANALTMTAWVYLYEEGLNGGIVFHRANSSAAGFGVGANGHLQYNWNDDPQTTGWDSGLALPLIQWAFVAWVATPTNSSLYVYSATGKKQATLVHSHPAVPFQGAIGIGCDPQGGDAEPVFNGMVDEVALFDRPLSNAELDQLYSAALGAFVPPAIALQPTNIIVSITGNSVCLSWPSDHRGWVAQSNSVNLLNTNCWFDIPNSQNGTNIVFSVDRQATNVFYRLRYP